MPSIPCNSPSYSYPHMSSHKCTCAWCVINGRLSQTCCSTDPCDDFNCSDRGYECQVYRPTGEPFCTPVCGPDSCDPGLQCSISTPPTCPTEPCLGILACDSSEYGVCSQSVLLKTLYNYDTRSYPEYVKCFYTHKYSVCSPTWT